MLLVAKTENYNCKIFIALNYVFCFGNKRRQDMSSKTFSSLSVFFYKMNIVFSPFLVKQRCSSDNFIAIKDKWENVAMHFHVWQRKRGRELTNGETERASLCERQSICGEEDSVGTMVKTFA